MKIDEVIEKLKSDAIMDSYNFQGYSMKQKEQIVDWLEELKELRKNANKWRKAGYKHGHSDGYNKAIDNFAERLKELLKGMQMAELQGEDVCPYDDIFKECPYINSELGCQYCAREQTIKDIDEIAEQLKK